MNTERLERLITAIEEILPMLADRGKSHPHTTVAIETETGGEPYYAAAWLERINLIRTIEWQLNPNRHPLGSWSRLAVIADIAEWIDSVNFRLTLTEFFEAHDEMVKSHEGLPIFDPTKPLPFVPFWIQDVFRRSLESFKRTLQHQR